MTTTAFLREHVGEWRMVVYRDRVSGEVHRLEAMPRGVAELLPARMRTSLSNERTRTGLDRGDGVTWRFTGKNGFEYFIHPDDVLAVQPVAVEGELPKRHGHSIL